MPDTNLQKALDSMKETGLYVIEQDTHKLLYFNKRVKEVSPGARLGMKCHDLWAGTCGDCPLTDMGERDFNHTIHYNDPFGEIVDISASRTLWNDTIPAFIITVIPHKLNFEEREGAQQIEKMYRQSLMTIFGECIIANLTKDYYVSCQTDAVWEKAAKQGRFSEINWFYAHNIICPEDKELFLETFSIEAMMDAFMKQGKKQISKKLRRLVDKGVYHMVEFTASKIEQTNESDCWCVLIFRDIHEEHLQEQLQDLRQNQLAIATRAAYQVLIAVNLTKETYELLTYDNFQGQPVSMSGSLQRLLQIGADTIDPAHRQDFLNKFSKDALIRAFSSGEKTVGMELRQRSYDGQYHWNLTQAVKVENPYNDDLLDITMIRNLDKERAQQEQSLEKERKAKVLLEEALMKAKAASQAKSQFLSRMSHDIRTPMNAIIGMTALAQHNLDDKGKLIDYLKKIEASGEHLLGLIKEVLDVNQIESGQMELTNGEFDLRNLISKVEAMLEPIMKQKKQQLFVDIQEELHSYVTGDEQKLRQVLVNITENASKYTGDGGEIRLQLRELKKEAYPIGTYQFIIEDNGIGMKEEYLEHIFEPFSRAEDSRISEISGTGLGMTIVANIVSMMEGDIVVESRYGEGSRFIITLCFNKADKAAVEEKQFHKAEAALGLEGEVPDYRGLRVLLVEDNDLNQQIAKEMLNLLEVKVEVASNGQEAVEAILRNPQLYYDLVFMDIQMPVMDGYEATKQIRSSGKPRIDELPIVAMTANAFTEDIKRSRLAGMDDHMSKPISLEELERILRNCARWKAHCQG